LLIFKKKKLQDLSSDIDLKNPIGLIVVFEAYRQKEEKAVDFGSIHDLKFDRVIEKNIHKVGCQGFNCSNNTCYYFPKDCIIIITSLLFRSESYR